MREFGAVVERAEFVDFVVGAGGLVLELVAGNVDDFEALVVEVGVHLFDGLVITPYLIVYNLIL